MGQTPYRKRGQRDKGDNAVDRDNAGNLSVDINDGGFGVGIGGGLVIESDGDLGIQIAPGISIDTGLDLF